MFEAGLHHIPRAELARMAAAADRLLALLADLKGAHLLGALIDPAQGFHAFSHYPDDDARDAVSGAQYYYHAHWNEERAAGEHGHFHCFLAARYPRRFARAVHKPESGAGRLSHLVALSIAPSGLPTRLFTVSPWVTHDTVYPAAAMKRALRHFTLRAASGPAAVNGWLEAVVVLFRPEIEQLLDARDAAWAACAAADPYASPELEVPSSIAIDIDARIAAVDAMLA